MNLIVVMDFSSSWNLVDFHVVSHMRLDGILVVVCVCVFFFGGSFWDCFVGYIIYNFCKIRKYLLTRRLEDLVALLLLLKGTQVSGLVFN